MTPDVRVEAEERIGQVADFWKTSDVVRNKSAGFSGEPPGTSQDFRAPPENPEGFRKPPDSRGSLRDLPGLSGAPRKPLRVSENF